LGPLTSCAGDEESLGDEDYTRLVSFDASETYRGSVDFIANAMRSKGVEIGRDLEETILGMYASAIQDPTTQGGAVDLSALSDAQRTDLKNQQMAAFRVNLLRRMSGVLDERQWSKSMATELKRSSSNEP
jgi:hypothetical protein